MANEISLEITENVTKVETTENVTTVEITPQVTTVELKGISIANAVNSSALGYAAGTNSFQNTSATVQSALDTLNTNALNKNIDQTITSPTITIDYNSKINFTAPGEGQNVYSALNLSDNDIINVNKITFADPGPDEGLQWSNTKIFESPNDLSTNAAGNFQVVYDGARKLSVDSAGIDVSGSITSSDDITTSKNIISNAVVEKLTKSGSVTLSKGDIVYLSGYANDAALVDKAIASDSSKMPGYGIVSSVSGNNVDVVVSGSVDFLPFSNLSSGQKLYVSADTAGALTTTAPTGQSNSVQNIANIEHTRASSFSTISEPTQATDTQHVYVSNVTKSADSTEVSITVSYKSDDTTTTGIGFLVNFDSNILTSPVVSNLYSTGNTSAGIVSGNTINFSWSSISSDWPGTGAVNLATITFTLSNNAVGDPTTISFTGVSKDASKSAAYQSQIINGVYKSQDFVGTIKLNTLARSSDTPNLNTGNILLGVNNIATPTSFDTTFGTSFATRSIGGLSDVDITTNAPTNNQALVWNNDKFVPADQAGAQTINFADLGTTPTTITGYGITDAFDGQYSSLSGKPTLYSDSAVDTHLNQSTAANNEVLSWNGSDYDWIAQSAGIALTDISVSGTEGTASGDGGIAYNNATGVFTYTPPELLQLGTTSTTALAGDTALLQLGTTSTTALAGDTALLQLGTTSTTALAGDTTLGSIGGNLDLATQVTGTLPVGNMAATALTTVQTAANEATQLALTTQEGDVVVRTDQNKTYMRNAGTTSPNAMSNFTLLATPTDSVTSVDGNTGAVTTLQIGTTATTALAGNTTLGDLGGQAALTFGIADDNAVEIDDTDVTSTDYARFTANGLEGRSASEVKTDLSLDSVENTAISTFAGSANITTVGTVTTGTWQGTAIADAYISSASTWDGKQDALTFGIADTNAVKVDSADVADDEYARFTANGLESRSTAEVLSDIGGQAALTFGIADTNAVKVDSADVADDEYARFTANGLESRSTAEVLSDIGGQAALTFGIADTNAVKVDSADVADDEYARFTANGLESRSTAEVLSDIGGQAALTFGIADTNAVKVDSADVADDEYARFTANGLESRSTAEVLSDIGGQAALTFGIADTNAVKVDSADVADDEYARFTANGLEGRSASEVKTDLSLDSVENTAISTFAGSANITTVGTVTTGTWQGTAIADAYISSASTWDGKQDALTFGIANTNAVKVDSADVADDEYARFTANGLESRSTSEVLSDIGAQAVLTEGAFVDGDKTKLDAVDNDTPAFDSVSIDTGSSTWEISESGNKLIFKYGGNKKMSLDASGNLVVDGDITAFGRSIMATELRQDTGNAVGFYSISASDINHRKGDSETTTLSLGNSSTENLFFHPTVTTVPMSFSDFKNKTRMVTGNYFSTTGFIFQFQGSDKSWIYN